MRILPVVLLAALLASATPAPAEPRRSTDAAAATEGRLAYYGHRFAGRATASGERFDPEAMTMAHVSLPFGTLVRVTNPRNRRSVVVRVNDRGPTVPGRVGDVSLAAARQLGMLRAGSLEARLEVLSSAAPLPP